MKVTVDFNVDKILKNHNLEKGGRAQQFVNSETLRLCDPYIPMDTKELARSGPRETDLKSNEVKWRTPYARKMYYQPANFQGAPMRGNYWGQRAMKNGGYRKIKEGLKNIVK